jgi:bacillolysin
MTSTARAIQGIAATAALAIGGLLMPGASAQQARVTMIAIAPDSITELREADQRISAMARTGELRRRRIYEDTLLLDREHERLDQYHRGVRIWGADVVRQIRDGQVVSTFGTVYEGVDVDTSPVVDEDGARASVGRRLGAEFSLMEEPELVILPREDSGYLLTWRLRTIAELDVREMFVDAKTGEIAFEYSNLQAQAPAIGRATGVLGDTKKISVRTGSGGYIANDAMRPPSALITFDMKGNVQRTVDFLNGRVLLGTSDIAFDSDNDWTDGAVTDAHVYAGFTYDYFFKRFNRRGLNDNNITSRALVHPVNRDDTAARAQFPTFFANAVYFGNGIILLGEGLPPGVTSGGRTWDRTAGAIDIVAHELAHGVTDFSSRLIFRNESGALNESFSDIMGTAVEFFFHEPGTGNLRGDYLVGEDAVKPGGIRSLANPRAYGHPDHYSNRFTGSADNGGVHINSSISNHAFYLAIEGGTNVTSGQSVQGVGAANRGQIEQVFYRAFTQMLTQNATFASARAATIQAARDLFPANGNVERAITDAWTAVGVQ